MKDSDSLDKLRERLYERGPQEQSFKRHALHDTEAKVARSWDITPEPERPNEVSAEDRESHDRPIHSDITAPQHTVVPESTPESAPSTPPPTEPEAVAPTPMPKRSKKRHYRMWLLAAGGGFFVIALMVASLFIIFGGNTISGENINIDAAGPFAVGGGEEITVQIAVANQNDVPIESATLIVEYPFGTQSATEAGKEIFSERFSLETIGAGELLNIPVKAIVFGEENDEKEIKVAIEYRVKGSNATFFREAEPLQFKISSSPVVLQVEGVEQISSGQEYEARLTVISNSPNTLTDLLVRAEYPNGFDVSESNPRPTSGQGLWALDELAPGERTEIMVRGLITGEENAERTFEFTVGVPAERSPFEMGSVFTTLKKSVRIEQPFLDLDVSINRSNDEVTVVDAGDTLSTRIRFTNPLNDALFDTVITVALSGSALSETDVRVPEGFYDSRTNTITWDRNSVSKLEELLPGATAELTFTVNPRDEGARTPEIVMEVGVESRRVFENNASESLQGSITRIARVASEATLLSSSEYNGSIFTNRGPIPPAAEVETTYTLSLLASSDTNTLSSAVVTAVLPIYVDWFNVKSSGADISFDERDRVVTWSVGTVEAGGSKSASFQIGLTPSLSQVGDTPVLLERQQLKATDKFTGSVVRASASAITTELGSESGFSFDNGEVQREAADTGPQFIFNEEGEIVGEQ